LALGSGLTGSGFGSAFGGVAGRSLFNAMTGSGGITAFLAFYV
jgi:hypothetical protein